MTEIKDKDLEQAAGGVFDKPGEVRDRDSGFGNHKPTTEDGYCEHFAKDSIYSENCCRGCAYFTKDFSGCFCMFK